MEVRFTRTALKDLRSLPRREAERMIEAIEAAARGDANADFRPLVGLPGLRIRAGRHRAIVEVEGGLMVVKRIAPRGEIYRR